MFPASSLGTGERSGPASVLLDDRVNLLHQAHGLGEGDDDLVVGATRVQRIPENATSNDFDLPVNE